MVKEEAEVAERFGLLESVLDERMRRLVAGAESIAIGYGGISIVSRATGVSRRAIHEGVKELKGDNTLAGERTRRIGGGRKKTIAKDASLKIDLEQILEPATCGSPQSPLRWTCKSVRKLAEELKQKGHQTSHRMVAELLEEMGYSLQGNRKMLEGNQHPDRNAQFEYINERVQRQLAQGEPVISVDTKKKELAGDFKNAGREWHKQGSPEIVRVYDFAIEELGRVNPYGVYDIGKNTAWVNVGIDHDTATFAVESIRRWWLLMGKPTYPKAKSLLITADGGGSNGSRVRLWKWELQQFANEFGISISVSHLPPGTSKWNKVEHRLFSYISQNWRGKPLTSHEVIVNLIAATTTSSGLTVRSGLDENYYPSGVKVSDDQMAQINIQRDDFHGEWNYSISPILS